MCQMGTKHLITAFSVLISTTYGAYGVSGRPPVFIDQPQTTYVLPHSSFKLSCSAGGWPVPVISWFRDGAPLKSLNGTKMNGSLVIDNATDGIDSAVSGVQYQCAASNSYGTVLSTMVKVYTTCEFAKLGVVP